jgi:hypothetical protein
VERHLEDPLAEIVLRGELRKGEPILVGASPEGLTFIQPESPKDAVKEKPKREPKAPKEPKEPKEPKA